jgi:hypothetical protein
VELLPPRRGPDPAERRQGALLLRGAGFRTPGHPGPQRRGGAAFRPALPVPGVLLRPLPRPAGGGPRHPRGRQGAPAVRHPRRRPGDLPRARSPVRHQGPRPGGRVHRALRTGRGGSAGAARDRGGLQPDAAPRPGGSGGPGPGRRAVRGGGPAQPPPPGHGDGGGLRAPHPPGRGGAGAVAVVRRRRGGGRGIYERCFDDLDAPVERVTGEDVPAPYARNLEKLAFPDEDRIQAAIRRVLQ